eukprot:GILI01002195.1.p1 GENE.GILI01002195.1~~GILI01002195.1.p1  ORF type:complete len:350 (+),score=80.98 GILI01002195.1:55-1050(+)
MGDSDLQKKLSMSLEDLIGQTQPKQPQKRVPQQYQQRTFTQPRFAPPPPPAYAPQYSSQPRNYPHQSQRPRPTDNNPSAFDKVLSQTSCSANEQGDTVVKFGDAEILVVKQGTGEIYLNTEGNRCQDTFSLLNDCLKPLDLKVSHDGDVVAGKWSVSDGKLFLVPLVDNTYLREPLKSGRAAVMMKARASILLQYLSQKIKTASARLSSVSSSSSSSSAFSIGGASASSSPSSVFSFGGSAASSSSSSSSGGSHNFVSLPSLALPEPTSALSSPLVRSPSFQRSKTLKVENSSSTLHSSSSSSPSHEGESIMISSPSPKPASPTRSKTVAR